MTLTDLNETIQITEFTVGLDKSDYTLTFNITDDIITKGFIQTISSQTDLHKLKKVYNGIVVDLLDAYYNVDLELYTKLSNELKKTAKDKNTRKILGILYRQVFAKKVKGSKN